MIESGLKEKLGKILVDNKVVLAYVFGSGATGKMGPLSDFDIAVLFRGNLDKNDYFDTELKLAGEIGQLLGVDRVDMVNLATSKNPLLKHNIISKGQPVFCEDLKTRFVLERNIVREYEDTKFLRDLSYKIMKRQIKDGTFGKAEIYVGRR